MDPCGHAKYQPRLSMPPFVHLLRGSPDLNRACLKDPYPLPSIDALVDGASSCRLLSFMDAYLYYNQIKMHPNDESKTAFITDEGNFLL
ncbi:hypothetical protein CR513_50578, partial [Mucuna pruriens]